MNELIEEQTGTFARGEEVLVPLLTGLVGLETDKPLNRITCEPRTAEGLSAFERPCRTQAAFKPIESAERRWRAVNAPHLVALVRAGATFNKGHPGRTTTN